MRRAVYERARPLAGAVLVSHFKTGYECLGCRADTDAIAASASALLKLPAPGSFRAEEARLPEAKSTYMSLGSMSWEAVLQHSAKFAGDEGRAPGGKFMRVYLRPPKAKSAPPAESAVAAAAAGAATAAQPEAGAGAAAAPAAEGQEGPSEQQPEREPQQPQQEPEAMDVAGAAPGPSRPAPTAPEWGAGPPQAAAAPEEQEASAEEARPSNAGDSIAPMEVEAEGITEQEEAPAKPAKTLAQTRAEGRATRSRYGPRVSCLCRNTLPCQWGIAWRTCA